MSAVETSFCRKSGKCNAGGKGCQWGFLGLKPAGAGFVGKAWREELSVLWGVCGAAAPWRGLTGLCLQMLALVPPAEEPSGRQPLAPAATPGASLGAHRQSQVLPPRERGVQGETGKIPFPRERSAKITKHPRKPRTARTHRSPQAEEAVKG